MSATISILIITYNRQQDLYELLKSISEQSRISGVLEEILILNNASTESYDKVLEFTDTHPELKISYQWSHENLGVARGRNELIRIAKGELLLMIDDDMLFPTVNELYKMAGLFEKPLFKNANTGIITFKVVYYDTNELQVTAFPHKKFDKYISRPQFLTYYFAGGAHVMKRSVTETAGLYTTSFHYGMEEYDFSYRLIEMGYTLGYDNEVAILHRESPYGRQANYRKLHMQWVNKSKVAWRYLPFIYFLSTGFLWSFQYLKGSKGHLGLYMRSWWEIFRIPFTEKRQKIGKAALSYLRKVEARLWY